MSLKRTQSMVSYIVLFGLLFTGFFLVLFFLAFENIDQVVYQFILSMIQLNPIRVSMVLAVVLLIVFVFVYRHMKTI